MVPGSPEPGVYKIPVNSLSKGGCRRRGLGEKLYKEGLKEGKVVRHGRSLFCTIFNPYGILS